MAILALRNIGVAGRSRLGMNTVIVGGLLISMAGRAHGLGRRGIVGKCLDIFVTVGATEDTMDGGFELRIVHMQTDWFAVLVFGKTGIVMASQAVIIAQLGHRLGQPSRTEQQDNQENPTATLHRNPRFR